MIVSKQLGDLEPEKKDFQVSVIIATYNRADYLVETLLDLARQKTPLGLNFEVVVADNASKDRTADVVRELAKDFPVPLHYLHEPKQGKSHALNAALRVARGEFFLFTDDDTKLPQDWVAQVYRTFVEYHADGVAGPVRPLWTKERPRWLSDRMAKQMGMVDHGPEPFVIKDEALSFIGPNSAYRRSLYLEMGGYLPGETAEDVEFFLRAFRSGRKLVYQPAAGVQHKVQESQMTRRYLSRRMFRQGRGNASGLQEMDKNRTIFRIPLWVPRYFLWLHVEALGSLLKGDREEAEWHWLRRHLYRGIIYYCFQDWLHRRPLRRDRPPVVRDAAPGAAS
ncbi:MAG TPA: glycosyltransferase [Verrucomicrobiae bacterium]|nr:glycosyltransferase [Verrucomicrobiae bacterium]